MIIKKFDNYVRSALTLFYFTYWFLGGVNGCYIFLSYEKFTNAFLIMYNNVLIIIIWMLDGILFRTPTVNR